MTQLYNRRVSTHQGRYERSVLLSVHGVVFARCVSAVAVERADAVHALESEGVPIGQLFRKFDILPRFELKGAGRVQELLPANGEGPVLPANSGGNGGGSLPANNGGSDEHAGGNGGGDEHAAAKRRKTEPPSAAAAQVNGAEAAEALFAAQRDRFWREYTLGGGGVTCQIREELRSDLFELAPPKSGNVGEGEGGEKAALLSEPAQGAAVAEAAAAEPSAAAAAASASLGDIMAHGSDLSVRVGLPNPSPAISHLSPAHRMLLTANGNVERILSSYYGKPVHSLVAFNSRRAAAGEAGGDVYDRQVALLLDGGYQLATAKSTCFVTDTEWAKTAAAERLPVGALFRRFDAMPTFALHSAGRYAGGWWRQYTLRAAGLTCEINETFDERCFDAPATTPPPALDGAYHGI